jgi:oxygen-independent coproporphyrinogen-3 oxidase
VREKITHEDWLAGYLREMSYWKGVERIAYSETAKNEKRYTNNDSIKSIFFGGGTPSLMEASTVEAIINHADKLWGISENCEITLEANPTSIEAEKFRDFKRAGINRVSMGIQSLIPEDLKFLGREHSRDEAIKAIETARKIFDNYSFDLIYARPNQTLNSWENELREAFKLAAKHLSLYQLTIEKGTPFYSMYQAKKFELPDENLATDMYELTKNICDEFGLKQYEISNYAVPGFESQHNLAYWNYDEYLGIGAGAHGRMAFGFPALSRDPEKDIMLDPGLNPGIQRTAIMNIHSPENWLNSVREKGHGIQTETQLTEAEQFEEKLMMGLRISKGVELTKLILDNINQPKMQEFIDDKIMKVENNFLAINQQYFSLHNHIVSKLLRHC